MKKKGLKNFFLLFFLAAVYFVLYILLTYHESYFAVGACGVILLTAGYLLVSELEKEKQEKDRELYQQAEKLQNYLKETVQIQKAIYTAVRKGNDAVEQQLKEMRDGMPGGLAAEEEQKLLQNIAAAQERAVGESKRLAELQVNALKAVAKYNKENARQLALNANENADRILAGLSSIESIGVMENRSASFTGVQEEQNVAAIVEDLPKDIEEAAVSEILSTEDTGTPDMEEPSEAEDILLSEPASEEMSEAISPELPLPELTAAEPVLPEALEEEAGVPLETLSAEPAETPSLDIPVPEPAEEFVDVPMPADPNQPMSPSEIEALIASLSGEDEAENEEIDIPIPDLTADLQPEEELKPEPEPEKKPAMPITDDPNHAMSPDEIAALIASMTQ